MFTPERLLDIAVTAAEQSKLGNEWWTNHSLAESALICAEWMENQGLKEVSMIGPFGNLDLKKGDKVRIKKFSVVHGFGKNIPPGGKTTERPYWVTVFNVNAGTANTAWDHGSPRNQTVNWVGEHGYWRWTDASNVEIIKAAA